MGFDVYGQNAATEKGEYFRNNCWSWRPLAQYVLSVCADIITDRDAVHWNYNDGHLVSENEAIAIADRLDFLSKSGDTREFAEKYKAEQDSIPDEVCELCNGTGKREDMEVENGCNGCNGTGMKEPMSKWYPFNEENVKEFAEFCRESGGFEIW